MSRLIDADKLAERIRDWGKSFYDFNVELALGCLMDAPTVDQWHYPSKGEYPPMDERVYLWMEGDVFPVVAKRHAFKSHNEEWSWYCYWGSGFILKHNDERIVAWQYIVPPKEKA